MTTFVTGRETMKFIIQSIFNSFNEFAVSSIDCYYPAFSLHWLSNMSVEI